MKQEIRISKDFNEGIKIEFPFVQELKRLQQEIDEAEIRRRELILHYFGSEMKWTLNDEEIHRASGELITENQQRIKEIIEQL